MASGAQKLPSLGLRGLTSAAGGVAATAAMPVTGSGGVVSARAAAGGASGVCSTMPFVAALGGVNCDAGAGGGGRPSSAGAAACVTRIRH